MKKIISTARPYSGNEPYIFISYSHRDSAFVYPIIEHMTRLGYRVWYDEGIVPGSEWTEVIADHITNANACMIFMSANTAASHNCKHEITYAIRNKKPLLSIFFEEAALSPGTEMQLSAFQAVYAQTYANIDRLMEVIEVSPSVKPCLGQPNPTIEVRLPSYYVEISPAPYKPSLYMSDQWYYSERLNPPEHARIPHHQSRDSEAPPVIQSGSAGQAAIQNVSYGQVAHWQQKSSAAAKPKRRIPKIRVALFIFLGIVGLISALWFIGRRDSGNYVRIGTESFPVTSTSLNLTGRSLSDRDIEPLSRMTYLRVLELDRNQISDLTPLSYLVNLSILTVRSNQVSDITPLSNLASLRTLHLTSNQINDLTPLSHLTSLTNLTISDNQANDMTPLSNLTNLTSLSANRLDINDLTFLSNLTGLTHLDIANNSFQDLSSISDMTSLTSLHFSGNAINDITPLSSLVNLTRLSANNNQISDLAPMSNLTSLISINFSRNNVSSIAPLSGLYNLREVSLSNNEIPLDGWQPLAHVEHVIGRPADWIPTPRPERTIATPHRGTWDSNNRYTNPHIGLSFQVPPTWIARLDEELVVYNDLSLDLIGEAGMVIPDETWETLQYEFFIEMFAMSVFDKTYVTIAFLRLWEEYLHISEATFLGIAVNELVFDGETPEYFSFHTETIPIGYLDWHAMTVIAEYGITQHWLVNMYGGYASLILIHIDDSGDETLETILGMFD